MVRIIFLLICLFSINQSAFALNKVTATIDRNPVVVNESFVLTVVADDDVNTNAFDTSALLNDFIVGRTSVSSQRSSVNFKTSYSTTWTTPLIAKKPGKYTIPALKIDNELTLPISLEVVTPENAKGSQQKDIFLTTSVSKKELYVQQQLTITTKLHFATELKRGNLSEPKLDDASIRQIGKDNESDEIIDGRQYRIIERTYAISPQKSGLLTLKPPVFSGEIMKSSNRRGNFFSFAETKPVSVISDDISLNVLPIPNSYAGTWLPSELVAIHQEWQPANNEFVVGEPITRIMTLTAVGLSEEQLPELKLTVPEGLKVYPDQAELHTGLNQGRLVSQSVRNFAIVASKPGSYQLPTIEIPWWNTITNRMEVAKINGQTIIVNKNPNAPEIQTPAPRDISQLRSEPAQTVYVERSPLLQWVFLSLWLLTMILWFFSYKKMKKTPITSNNQRNTTLANEDLIKACKSNDATSATNALLPWLNNYFQLNESNLTLLLNKVDNPELCAAITELQRCKFGKNVGNWQGKNLLVLLQKIKSGDIKKSKGNNLNTHLNPS